TTEVWPIINANCYSCHSTGGAGEAAMSFDDPEAEDQGELDDFRAEAAAAHCNFMIPEASYLLRKPLGEALGGLSHAGGKILTDRNDPQYKTIYAWIASANPALAAGVTPTDMVSVTNYPNPFRDTTFIVYGLTGVVGAKITIRVYSQNGKMI